MKKYVIMKNCGPSESWEIEDEADELPEAIKLWEKYPISEYGYVIFKVLVLDLREKE